MAPSGSNFAAVAVGGYHACAIAADYTVDCWGDNHFGQTDGPISGCRGSGVREDCLAGPRAVCLGTTICSGDLQATDISLGKFHSCAVTIYRTLSCWGLNQDMNGVVVNQSIPPGGIDFKRVSAGGYHSCALKTDKATGQAKPTLQPTPTSPQ